VIVKQNASLYASFWINVCAASLVQFVSDYFVLFSNIIVAQEIRYPLDVLGIASQSTILFNDWVQSGIINLQDPKQPLSWFQSGENAAIALAMEHDCFLLMDDANPYHRAKAIGLKIAGSGEFTILLYDHGRISNEMAVSAIKQTHASKKQKRLALVTLETLKRYKES
jgi:predicted nucleic acid-binding protein